VGRDLLPLEHADGRIHRGERRGDGAEGEVLSAASASPVRPPRGAALAARLTLLLTLALGAALACAADLPALIGRVVDQANILSPATRAALDAKLRELEDKSGIQLVVATVASLGGEEIEPYANRLFRAWRLGEAKKNNGVLFLVAPNDHRVRIEVGYGLEGTLTDATSKIIIVNAVAPRFKAGDFNGGVSRGVDDIITALTTDASEWQKAPRLRAEDNSTLVALLPFVIFLAIFMLMAWSVVRQARRRGLASTVASSGGFWSGFSSGGFSGGGSFDGGGFSGGGGSSGGGGASGSW
jgi:uncharacterized protein